MTSASDIAFASALDLAGLYGAKALSPVEAAEALFARLDALQPRLNAFCIVDRDGALAAARAAEGRWLAGRPLGPLDGVPVTIKDLVLMRGFPTRRGSRLTDPVPDTEDGPAVARLREAGAVIMGKTTSPEFGWKAIGDSPLTGVTRNPWNLGRTPGGSSAGAAAACAAGIAPLHVGSDGAGSIRIPSSFTGIFGLKATFGRVPAYPSSPMGLLSNVGPMTRHVRDAAALLNVLARPDPRDPYTLPPETRDYLDGIEDGVKGLRIAYSPDLGFARVDPEIAACCAAAARRFEGLGAIVEEVDAIFPSPREALLTLWGAGTARLLAGFPAERHSLCDPGLITSATAGARISGADYVGADLARTALGAQMAAFHRRYDLLLTPMMPVAALPVGQDLNDPASERHWIDWSPFSYPFNMTRQPAASIPCGLTGAGLPIGLQIVGPLYAEDRVLRAARAFERLSPNVAHRFEVHAMPDKTEPGVVLTDAPDTADTAIIQEGLRAYNTSQAGYDDSRPLAVFVTDPGSGKVLGGLYGGSYMGQLRVDRFFLPERLRRGRLGSRLLAMAEEEGRRRGCTRVTLNTMEIQARGFYEKQGYETAATLDCAAPGVTRYLMTKRLG